MSARAVEVEGLTKVFRGTPGSPRQGTWSGLAERWSRWTNPPPPRVVVDGISLTVERGEFFGIIGGNGAGKTTLLKLLSCLLYPDGGGGRVNGFDLYRQRSEASSSVSISKAQAWNGLGILWQLTCRENLLFRARLAGVRGAEARRRTDAVLERLEIAHKAGGHSWEMSIGERQRLSLAMTFVAGTPLVLLDEPTSNLDPHTARLVRAFARDGLNRANGQTVILSTHYLEEADLLCDRVAIVRAGRLLAVGSPAELKARYLPEKLSEIRARGFTREIGEALRGRRGIEEILAHFEDLPTGQARLRPKWRAGAPGDVEGLCAALEEEGVTVVSVRRVAPSLDDVYFAAAGGAQ